MHFQGALELLARPCHRSPGLPSVPSEWQRSQLVAKHRNSVLVLSHVLSQRGLTQFLVLTPMCQLILKALRSGERSSFYSWWWDRCELMLCSLFHPLTLSPSPRRPRARGSRCRGISSRGGGGTGAGGIRWHLQGPGLPSTIPPSQLTPKRKEMATKQGHGGRWLEGCRGLLGGSALTHSAGFVTSCRPAVPSAGLGIGAGFGIPRAGRAGGGTDSWGSVTAAPGAPQSPPRSLGTVPAPVPPVTTPFFFHFSHKHKKIEPPELPSWPPCLSHTIPALSPVPSSQLAAGHPQHRALELHYQARLGQHLLESCHDHSEFHRQRRTTLFKDNNNKIIIIIIFF